MDFDEYDRKNHPPGSLVKGIIQKKEPGEKAGLHLEVRRGRIYISYLTDKVLKNPVNVLRVGDQVFEIQGKTVDKYTGGMAEIRQILENDTKVAVLAQRSDPDASSASTDSLYDGQFDDDYWSDDNGVDYEEVERPATKESLQHHEIEIGTIYELRKLTKKELNGSLVKVLEEDTNTEGRWRVEIRTTKPAAKEFKGQTISVASEKLFRKITIGDTMKLKNLSSAERLNGHFVKVKKRVSKNSARWIVDVIETGENVSVAAKNLEFAS